MRYTSSVLSVNGFELGKRVKVRSQVRLLEWQEWELGVGCHTIKAWEV